jgi:hypothetical protein
MAALFVLSRLLWAHPQIIQESGARALFIVRMWKAQEKRGMYGDQHSESGGASTNLPLSLKMRTLRPSNA